MRRTSRKRIIERINQKMRRRTRIEMANSHLKNGEPKLTEDEIENDVFDTDDPKVSVEVVDINGSVADVMITVI